MTTKTPPPDTRPYRAQHATGDQMVTFTDEGIPYRQTWRQVGWHGQTGAFYALGEDPGQHEPGSFSPLWLLVDNEPVVTDEDEGQP